jgi:hypothetical protein
MKLVGLFTASPRGIALTTTHCLWMILLFAGFVFHPEIATAQEGAITGIPSMIAQCERTGTTQNCSTWKWNGKQFDGRWPNGRVGQMTVERFDSDGVVITRVDQTGASPGLTATYMGKLHGDGTIQGTAVWVLNGKSVRGTWTGTFSPNPGGGIGKAAQSIPSVMHFCGANCTTLTWDHGHYVAGPRNSWDPPNFSSIWTVENFTRESVILHRHDSPNPANPNSGLNGWDVVYTGQMSKEGNSLINATQNGSRAPNLRLTWGTALNSTPESNAERDRAQASHPPKPSKRDAHLYCT